MSKIQAWLLRLATRRKNVSFSWVPRHVNISGNERADREAKDAIATLQVDRTYLPPHTDLYPIIKRAAKRKWNEDWSNIRNNKLRNIIHVTEDWKSAYHGNRRTEVIVALLRIDLTLATHGYLMEGRYAPFCDDCIVPFSVQHLLEE